MTRHRGFHISRRHDFAAPLLRHYIFVVAMALLHTRQRPAVAPARQAAGRANARAPGQPGRWASAIPRAFFFSYFRVSVSLSAKSSSHGPRFSVKMFTICRAAFESLCIDFRCPARHPSLTQQPRIFPRAARRWLRIGRRRGARRTAQLLMRASKLPQQLFGTSSHYR